MNTAARLQSLAEAGEVVFSKEAFRAVARRFPEAEARSVELKGKQGAFDVHVLRVPRPA
jgi:class 3 adenylate cyclase